MLLSIPTSTHLNIIPPRHRSFPEKGIGRMILKEEMRARSGCHDNEQWGSQRSSRCSSKEALNDLGFSSVNICESLTLYNLQLKDC